MNQQETGTHLSHCYQDEYKTSCKYGDADCPAKPQSPPPQVILSNFAFNSLVEVAEAMAELECVADTEGESGCNHCLAEAALQLAGIDSDVADDDADNLRANGPNQAPFNRTDYA